ncbi:zinc finger BED domain-containing protein DAYSLEEPER-like [Cornus florida]|uniref:zinc finger BED domain-containing protein DAYSLEEPER-like n=1 Tax=Cornus florida TaxID=4283 RepID=UPI00289EEBC6|nr:zinc finger BED domain-containing protein DAYSLEEPER-like [Cornus florida]
MVCSIDSSDISTSGQVQMVDVTVVLQGAEEPYGSVVVATPTENNEPPNLETQPNKRSRKKSIVWDYFTIETVGDDCTRAYCKQCRKSFAYITGSKLAGTSHLKRHISLGICPVSRLNQEKNQPSLYNPGGTNTDGSARVTELPRKRYRGGSARIPFDQDRSRHDIAKMIILHEYPLHIVEHPGFVDFVRTLQPDFSMVSFNTVQDDCVGLYLREKQSVLGLLSGIPGRVSLTLDLWTSFQNLGYVILTGHFIDGDWKLHRRILNVIVVPYPESEFSFNDAVAACLTNWSLDNKLFTLTLDQSFVSATVRENLRGLLNIKNPLILNGQLLIGNCFARVLSCLAQDALGSMRDTIRKVRRSVKYVKTSEVHEEKFVEVKQQLQVPSKESLVIDDQTKWNTTYRMLVAACGLKEVFSCLDTSDPNYKETPSMDEWKKVETVCKYLKLLYDAANILTATTYPTANIFFHEVWKIQLELMHAVTNEDIFVRNLIRPLQEKFDRYWKDSCLVLAIAVIMDPRFKMKLVEFSFSRIYGENAEAWNKTVDEGVRELFLEYIVQSLPPPIFMEGEEIFANTEMMPQEGTHLSDSNDILDFDVDISDITCNQQMKSELDEYLDEPLLPRVQDFDVLGWWKLNRLKYPTLSKLASDILCLPVSTVDRDSVFDTACKKVDSYRTSLKPATLEALVCAKDWFQYE